jgi:hypothetical protein
MECKYLCFVFIFIILRKFLSKNILKLIKWLNFSFKNWKLLTHSLEIFAYTGLVKISEFFHKNPLGLPCGLAKNIREINDIFMDKKYSLILNKPVNVLNLTKNSYRLFKNWKFFTFFKNSNGLLKLESYLHFIFLSFIIKPIIKNLLILNKSTWTTIQIGQ